MSEFSYARARLTIWYTLILFVVSVLLSGLYYWRSMQIIHLQSQRLEQRLQQDVQDQMPPRRAMMRAEIFQTELEVVTDQLRRQIVFINLLVLGFGSAFSYLLAGKTLRPIERVFATQRRFISDASHELKTPLTALRTSLEVSLLDNKIGKTATKVLQENLVDITNLQTLTENLLSLARTREGSQLERTAIPLGMIVQQATKKIVALAKQKKITLKLESDPIFNIRANEQSVLRVLIILLDNAIKYSPEKSTITITTQKQRRTGSIVITDQGIGIAPKHQVTIFERFFRVASARTKSSDAGGHGLGLSVARELLAAMGGSISLKSTLGSGSTFTITLPLA